MRSVFLSSITLLLTIVVAGCGSDPRDGISDVIDVVDGVDRQEIDKSITGVNAFFNDSRFGSLTQQAEEIQGQLGLRYVRLLFAWTDDVQPSPDSPPNLSFYDDIVDALPPGVDAIAVLTDVPSWMSDSGNWIDGDPRLTFVRRWVDVIANRYGSRGKLSGFQVWNEPNFLARRDNVVLALDTAPSNYLALMSNASASIRRLAPGKLVISAATTAINQNYPQTLDYNRSLRDGGLYSQVDVIGIHYYGRQFENVVRPNGIADFLESVTRPIWVTESGAQGTSTQLKYVEEVWPYLREKIPAIERFYYYQMYEPTDPASTYGLRNLSSSASVSDLYVYLRDGTR